MSDHEPSYYEIALTNRQVVVAFVILLVCIMGSFFAGVWVGDDDASRSAAVAEPMEQMAADAQDIEQLDFFGGGGEVAAPDGDAVEVRHEPVRPTGAEEESGRGGAGREDPVVQRNRREARRAAAERGDIAGGEGAALSTTAPRAEPPTTEASTADARRTPASSEPARKTPPPPSGAGPVIQVFSSNERDQAQKVVDRLTGAGQRAYLSPQEVDGRTMYRVRIGPFADRAQAEKVAVQVKQTFRLDTWITQ